MNWRYRFRRCCLVVGLACAAFLSAAAVASAQDYDEMPLYQLNGKPVQTWPQLNGAALDDKTKAVQGMLSGDPMDTTVFDPYFNDIVFPLFTLWKDVKVGNQTVSPLAEGIARVNPPTARVRFKTNFVSKATSTAAHDHLNELTLTKMDQIASGNYHPVVRANAMMMIVDLSDTEPNSSNANGVPYKKALPILWKYATAKDTIDAVRIPAWRGLVRQAQAGIDADHKPSAVSAAIDALQKRKDLGGSTQDAKDWICRRAIDVLVALNDPSKANNDVSAVLLATINDNATSMTIRAAAAAALSKIKLGVPQNFNADNLAKSLGQLAVDDYKGELDAATHALPIVADRLALQLGEIRLGLVGDGSGGVRALSTTPDFQKYVDSMVGPLDNLIAACGTKLADAPAATVPATGGVPVAIPIDRQQDLATAIETAGNSLGAAVSRTQVAPTGTAPAGAPGKTPAADENPLGG